MILLEQEEYIKQLKAVTLLPLPWDKLNDKRILISGATGMVGTCLVHVLTEVYKAYGLTGRIYALSRNSEKAKERFKSNGQVTDKIEFISHDINQKLCEMGNMDYIIHGASNTHPVAYATDPIGTITTNVSGTFNLLDYAATHNAERFMLLSSVEVYGENKGDTDKFTEESCGYIDCNTVRAGYPEGKRVSESLCQAYKAQKGLNVIIARLARTYGPTMLPSDTKAISQFIKKGVADEDIVLKSSGTQFYSYVYVLDAVSALLTIMLKGKNGEAYNISGLDSDVSLKDLAQTIANISGKKVIFEIPDQVESEGYSKATKAVLDSSKLYDLGWESKYPLKHGLEHTIKLIESRR